MMGRIRRLAYAILDGTLIPIDRVAAQKPYYATLLPTPRPRPCRPSSSYTASKPTTTQDEEGSLNKST